jgi:hypothetical protein
VEEEFRFLHFHLHPTISIPFHRHPQKVEVKMDQDQDQDGSRPGFAKLEQMKDGPLAAKAALLQKMLVEDNERIFSFINEGDDLKDVPIGDSDERPPTHP